MMAQAYANNIPNAAGEAEILVNDLQAAYADELMEIRWADDLPMSVTQERMAGNAQDAIAAYNAQLNKIETYEPEFNDTCTRRNGCLSSTSGNSDSGPGGGDGRTGSDIPEGSGNWGDSTSTNSGPPRGGHGGRPAPARYTPPPPPPTPAEIARIPAKRPGASRLGDGSGITYSVQKEVKVSTAANVATTDGRNQASFVPSDAAPESDAAGVGQGGSGGDNGGGVGTGFDDPEDPDGINPPFDLAEAGKSGELPDPTDKANKFSMSGRALNKRVMKGTAKHLWPIRGGSVQTFNEVGQKTSIDMLDDPSGRWALTRAQVDGNYGSVWDLRISDETGARFSVDGMLKGFLDPYQAPGR